MFFLMGGAVFAQSATLISQEIEICLDEGNAGETFTINYEIDFEGNSPFDALMLIEIYNEGNVSTNTIQSANNWAKQNDENYQGFYSFTPSSYSDLTKIRITIAEFRDNNTNWLTENVSGEIITNILKKPTPSISDNTIESCGYSTEITVVPGNEGGIYKWESATSPELITFSSSDQSKTIFSAPDEGIYSINFVQTNGKTCFAKLPIQVELLGSPRGAIYTDSEVCGVGDVTLQFNVSGNQPFEVAYTNGINSFDETIQFLSKSVLLNDIVGGTEFSIISIKDGNECYAETEDIVNNAVVIDLTPFVDAGIYDEICGDEITLSANTLENGMTGKWTSPDGYFNDETLPNATFFADGYEISTLIWTVTNKGWCSNSDEVEIRFWETPLQPDVDAGENQLLYYTSNATLNASSPRIGTGMWSTNDNAVTIAQPKNPASEVSELKYGDTKFTWTVTNGICLSVSGDVIITIKGLRCPTGFSPNGDGINDYFVIEGAEQIRNNQLIVFDKDGYVVFKQSGYKEGNFWDGTQNGTPVPDGIYHYVFSGEDVEPVKNFLVIKRTRN